MGDDVHYIYVIGTSDGPVKIGRSINPDRRLKDYIRERSEQHFIFGKWPVGARIALSVERYVHWQLRRHHIQSEWFNVARQTAIVAVREAIKRRAEFGDQWNAIPALEPNGLRMQSKAGTLKKIDALRAGKETRADFIREAVEREIKRRERAKPEKPKGKRG